MPERTVNAPEKDWLTREEAAAWLGVDVGVFMDLVREGIVPHPIPLPRKTRRWHWMDVVAAAHLLTRRRATTTPTKKRSRSTGGKPGRPPKSDN